MDEPTDSHPSVWMLTLAVCTLALIAFGVFTARAEAAQPKRGTPAYCRAHAANEYTARVCIIRVMWAPLKQSDKAVSVAHCESKIDPRAANGQYLGVWQMGSGPRNRFGHGNSVETQTRAAIRYYREAGWQPWSCA